MREQAFPAGIGKHPLRQVAGRGGVLQKRGAHFAGNGTKLGDHLQNGVFGEGLGQEPVHHGLLAGKFGQVGKLGRNHDDAAIRLELLQAPGHLQAVEVGEVIIQHGHLITLGELTGVQFLAKPLLGRDLVTGPPQNGHQGFPGPAVIIDH